MYFTDHVCVCKTYFDIVLYECGVMIWRNVGSISCNVHYLFILVFVKFIGLITYLLALLVYWLRVIFSRRLHCVACLDLKTSKADSVIDIARKAIKAIYK